MHIEFFPIFIASLATFFAIVILRPFAVSVGLTDNPSERKLHVGSVPLIGGIAMFFGVVISILILKSDTSYFNYFLLSSLILVSIGVWDDHRDISVSFRLLCQFLVAIIIVSADGLSIISLGNLFGNGEFFLNGWAYFITVFVIIAGINAVNMADGIDGLAAGNSLITFTAVLILSIGSLFQEALWVSILFCSVLPVFLIHNLCLGVSKDKRIFMGDAGSMFIGIGIVWVLLVLSQGENQIFNPVTALWLFSAPIIDMTASVIRRIMDGKSPFHPDTLHTHHLLLDLGIGKNSVLLLVLLFSLLMAIFGILGEIYGVPEWVMFYAFIIIFIIYMFLYRLAIIKINNNAKLGN
jgi:UDP-GlcNAc:undecaprenyl-phosphate GlcNAc-1-phosphate transferase